MDPWILGIDTSNYTTSAAAVDRDGKVLYDARKLLRVKEGQKGLRQSEALFQHVENLPGLLEELFRALDGRACAGVCASEKPRPVEGSYMPAFLPGLQQGRALAAALAVPFCSVSHQEGHFAAAAMGTELENKEEFLAFHLSGGTCELIYKAPERYELLGGTLDISMGQLLDRLGVAAGLPFPAGGALDRMAMECFEKRKEVVEGDALGLQAEKADTVFKPIPVKEGKMNLSGLETQCLRALARGDMEVQEAAARCFTLFGKALTMAAGYAAAQTGCKAVLFGGGVSASSCLRELATESFAKNGLRAVFGEKRAMGDNAIGTALLGRSVLWR